MNILVTGGAGYIGSQLIRDIAQCDIDKVTILDNMSRECYYSLMNLPSRIEYEFIEGDIRDLQIVEKAVQGINTVIHLAALTNAPESFERREETKEINYEASMNLLKSSLSDGVEKFVFASTTSVYGQTNGIVDETYQCKPVSPYALYKLKAEQEILQKAKNREINAVALRLATVFGYSPGIRFHTVLNKFVYMACAGIPLTIYGTGEQKRPFLHVKDASRALLFCMENNNMKDDVFNVVSRNASVNEIVQCIKKKHPEVKTASVDREILNQISYVVDSSKIRKKGFVVKNTIDEEIEDLMKRFETLFTGG
ncbi:MAG: NAD-dependent epimerase/dehydratase family protein [Candidatus Methanofastidiosia archaeon]|jgi:nucleoside-diphosphate-sugar epimerase